MSLVAVFQCFWWLSSGILGGVRKNRVGGLGLLFSGEQRGRR